MAPTDDPKPRRSIPGPQSKTAARPRRAFADQPDEPAQAGTPGPTPPVGPASRGATSPLGPPTSPFGPTGPRSAATAFARPGAAAEPTPLARPARPPASPASPVIAPGTTPTPATPGPSVPLAPSQPAPDSIDNYRPKKQRGWLIGISAVVIAIAATLIIVNYRPVSPPPAPSPRPTTYATPTRAGGVGFKNSVVQGYWKITDTTWTAETVRLSLEITVDRGTLFYDLYAYQADGTTAVDPTWLDPTDLKPGFVGPGETITGTLTFAVSRQRLTLVMSTRDQAQLSALAVAG